MADICPETAATPLNASAPEPARAGTMVDASPPAATRWLAVGREGAA